MWPECSAKGVKNSPLDKEIKDEINEYLQRRREKGISPYGSYADVDGQTLPPHETKPYIRKPEIKEVIEQKHKRALMLIRNCLNKKIALNKKEVSKLETLRDQEAFLSSGQRAWISRIHKKLFGVS